MLFAAIVFCLYVSRGNDRGYLHSPTAARGYLFVKIFGYVVCNAAHGEEIVNAAVKGHFEAFFHALAEAEVGILVAVGQPLKAHFLVHKTRYKPRFIRKRRAAVKKSMPRANVEVGLSVAGYEHRHGHDIVLIGIKHAARIRRNFYRAQSALPGGFYPYYRRFGQRVRIAAKQHIGIIGIACQRHAVQKLFYALGRGIFVYVPAEVGCAPRVNLLLHEPALDVHIFFYIKLQVAAVFVP